MNTTHPAPTPDSRPAIPSPGLRLWALWFLAPTILPGLAPLAWQWCRSFRLAGDGTITDLSNELLAKLEKQLKLAHSYRHVSIDLQPSSVITKFEHRSRVSRLGRQLLTLNGEQNG